MFMKPLVMLALVSAAVALSPHSSAGGGAQATAQPAPIVKANPTIWNGRTVGVDAGPVANPGNHQAPHSVSNPANHEAPLSVRNPANHQAPLLAPRRP